MPSVMIHLLTAYKLFADTDPLFYIGAIVPDAVATREEKDITHFRTIQNRENELINLAKSSKKSFDEGILLHLYLDWLWDERTFCTYAETHKEENWFYSYRREIALASAFIYHNERWSEDVWQKMLSCPKDTYGTTPGVSDGEVAEFLNRNYIWHKDNNIGPSVVYPPEFVEEFTNNATEKFMVWRSSIN
ncbi:MAG: hypothetical protein A2Y40_06445 [Candidatus Margulisbacteria bacterium GWF2_35_9]|nr:MAG: hypothetical protein A2Y40_06445 [Candidatus Margulisbacteria bacterium GWF2_35_9]